MNVYEKILIISAMMTALHDHEGVQKIGGFFIADYDNVTLCLHFNEKAKNNANTVFIEYVESLNLFNMTFLNSHLPKARAVSTCNNVSIRQLKEIFEEETGLHLR